ncbi:hypothetical protein CKO12_02690 [Chromatium okenii]|uniref:tetratricopeptide repeat protein n=1 Tax=Chromatium okenii TaxID=61644 RepID=UPI00190574C9|nr:tetratricopeptide repeat protein [Chromatium okenii]MBK1640804.1 hypothetical protein [Chromatium okenii]
MKNMFILLMTMFLFGCGLFPTDSIAANENIAQNHFTNGNALFQNGDYKNALNEYQKALKATDSKNHPEVTFNQSMALYKLGKIAEADALYSTFIKNENERLLNNQRLERSLFIQLFAPELQAWPNWVAKYAMYIVGLMLIAVFLSVASDGGAAVAFLLILPIAVVSIATGYAL